MLGMAAQPAKAHRCILATRSPVFEAMFRSKQHEGTEDVGGGVARHEAGGDKTVPVYCGFDEIEGEAILDEHWK